MIRKALSILTIGFVSSLLIAAGIRSTENMDLRLPERAERVAHQNDKLFNSSIDSCADSSRPECVTEKKLRIINHDQDLLELQRQVNMKTLLRTRG